MVFFFNFLIKLLGTEREGIIYTGWPKSAENPELSRFTGKRYRCKYQLGKFLDLKKNPDQLLQTQFEDINDH